MPKISMLLIRVLIIRAKPPVKTAESEEKRKPEIKRAAQPSEISRLCSSDLFIKEENYASFWSSL